MNTKNFFISLIAMLLIVVFAVAKEPVKVIFDTDMGPDYDDVGAITVLHSLANKNECEILATVASDGYPYIASTIEVFNRYFNRPNIPIGVPGKDAPYFSCPNHWNDSLVMKFLPKPKTNADYPSAVKVYREVLSKQDDQSVVIITVGFISNLADLLKSEPDEFSKLNGKDLVKKKVKKWVAMAGGFPEGDEFNVAKHADASYYVFENWPSPVLFSGFEIGVKILTGNRVAKSGAKNSPVQWAYDYNLKTYEGKEVQNRCSWDHTAVLCAVRNPEDYFYVIKDGTFVCEESGQNTWDPDKNSHHDFLVHKYPYQHIADILDELMMEEPSK
ncbi:nucleoside hydrolase [Sunxiuqinia sp. A32]|uniref:nucleoside hydrolase n=1 Tax=Sunxiuqinia sp. A32 TaxID=3461496 RepID=UPI0040468497